MLDVRGYPDFGTASNAVLKLLRDRIGFDLWMITRVVDEEWIVLQAEDHGYGVHRGQVFAWNDSFCSRMVKGEGPSIAPQANLVDSYRSAPIGQQVQIGAYIGMPLFFKDGDFFGTLCGIHPTAYPEEIQKELPLIEVLSRLLSSLLETETSFQNERRRAERAEAEAQTDALTGLYNRRGWDNLLAAEESRCQALGYSAGVIVIDLDNLKQINDVLGHDRGDLQIQKLANILKESVRKEDVVARLGGDEFGILGIEMDLAKVQSLLERLESACAHLQVDVSMGLAIRNPSENVWMAWQQADAEMYIKKRSKKAALIESQSIHR